MSEKVQQVIRLLEELNDEELKEVISHVVMTREEAAEFLQVHPNVLTNWAASQKHSFRPLKRGVYIRRFVERKKVEQGAKEKYMSPRVQEMREKRIREQQTKYTLD